MRKLRRILQILKLFRDKPCTIIGLNGKELLNEAIDLTEKIINENKKEK